MSTRNQAVSCFVLAVISFYVQLLMMKVGNQAMMMAGTVNHYKEIRVIGVVE